MGILELNVKGYRSLKNITWKPGNLNVLIGPNGSGKSNLLRSLELMSMTSKGNLGKYIQSLGGMDPLVWDGSVDSIGFSFTNSPVKPGRSQERDSLIYELELTRLGKSGAFSVTHESLVNYYKVKIKTSNEPFKFIERNRTSVSVFNEAQAILTVPEESIPADETILSRAIAPFALNHHISDFREYLASWSIYHDVHVNRDAAIRQSTVARNEKRLDPDGQNLISVLHTLYETDRAFKSNVNNAMTAAFGDDFEELVFPPAADQRIQLRLRWKSLRREQSVADLSDGTLRFLLLLAVLASPDPAPLIAIDEPEIGLHPSMFPIIAEYAIDAADRTQVILSTHSPEFLSAFKETIPTTSVLQWKNGQTSIETLHGPELNEWLKSYSLGALFKSGELENMVNERAEQP